MEITLPRNACERNVELLYLYVETLDESPQEWDEAQMSEWQPIETAPKDGTVIDLWIVNQDGRGWREADAYWVDDAPVNYYGGSGERRSGWFGPNHDYEGEDGWADEPGYANMVTGVIFFYMPTHWMPLPAPPSA